MAGSSLLNLSPSAAITSPAGSLCLISSKCCHQSGVPQGNWGDFSSLLKCFKGSHSFTKHPKSFPFRRISKWGVRPPPQPCHSCPQPDIYVATNRSPWWLLVSQHLHRIFQQILALCTQPARLHTAAGYSSYLNLKACIWGTRPQRHHLLAFIFWFTPLRRFSRSRRWGKGY